MASLYCARGTPSLIASFLVWASLRLSMRAVITAGLLPLRSFFARTFHAAKLNFFAGGAFFVGTLGAGALGNFLIRSLMYLIASSKCSEGTVPDIS